MTCWKQTRHRDIRESLPGKPPCTIAVPACTQEICIPDKHSGLRAAQILITHTLRACLFFWRPWAYFPEIFLSLRASRLSVSITRCHQLQEFRAAHELPVTSASRERRAAYGSTQGAADPWIPTSDPRMLPAAVCALPASQWHLHPQQCLAAAGAFLLNDPLHGKAAVNNPIYLSILLPASYRG